MHEISICQSILKTIEGEMEHTDFENVREIHLKIGLLSNIDAKLLKHVFTFVKMESSFTNAELHVEVIDILAYCHNCQKSFKVEKYKFICSDCGTSSSNILEGEELLINKIVLEEKAHEEINQ